MTSKFTAGGDRGGQSERAPDIVTSAISKGVQAVRDLGNKVTGHPEDPRTSAPNPPFAVQTQDAPGEEYKMDPKPDYGYDTYRGSGKLTDKIALITGGDSGIGRAVALAFAREGADVAISYLDEHKDAEETARVVQEAGRTCLLIPGDIAEDAQCQRVVQDTVDKFGRIDILVNNAAYQGAMLNDITEFDRERVEHTFRVNIIAMFSLVKYAKPHMRPGSNIINTSSINAYQPMPNILDYSTTKGAIVTFTKGLNNMLLSNDGIRVNSVAPGPVWTPIMPASFPAYMTPTAGASMAPIKRPAQPRELAPAYVFLASNADSAYVSAEILAVTGGMVTA